MINKRNDRISIAYYINNNLHNPHKPAIKYKENRREMVYYLNGIQQNIVGPQRIYPSICNYYYINGNQIGYTQMNKNKSLSGVTQG